MKTIIGRSRARKSPARQFLTAIELSVIAVSLRWAVTPWLGEHHEFLPGYAAVVAATWLGTWHAGVAVAVVSLIALGSPLFHPGNAQLLPQHLQDLASVLAFVFVAALLTYLTHHASKRIDHLSREVTRLDAMDHKKSDFLAEVAHELRNPLSAICLGSGLIKAGHLDTSAAQNMWAMIERQTDQMKRLVADLVDMARIEQGKIELERKAVRVGTLVRQAARDAAAYTQPKGQTIECRIEGDTGDAYVDAMRIGQVLGNLLHNASKFSPDGASIEISAQATPQEILIRVRDHGMGIPQGDLGMIFDSFVQRGTRSSRAQGLGLGLALCSKLVQLHGGTIQARSDGPGHGAEFMVRLPQANASAPAPQARVDRELVQANTCPANAAAPAPLRLLVVDDNRDAAESLALLLRMMGHRTSTAGDGQSALRHATEENPDVVFLDIGLPDMSGHEVAKRLRRQGDGEGAVLVALSGLSSPDDLRRSRSSGFDAHLTKPVSMEQIEQTLTMSREHAACHLGRGTRTLLHGVRP